jgi:hypothetical protein
VDPSRADEALLNSLRETNRDKTRPAEYFANIEKDFRDRQQRYEYRWMTYAFEAVFLAAWLLFVFWPVFLVSGKPSRLKLHWRLGLAPFLLFLPFFLGFAPMALTYGPTGGFVYPHFLMYVGDYVRLVPCTQLDSWMIRSFPNLLGSLSQLSGAPLAYSGRICVGPASSLIFAGLVVGVTELILYFKRRKTYPNR